MTRVRPAGSADLPRCRAIQTAALDEPWPDLLGTALETDAVFLVVAGEDVLGYAVALATGSDPAYVPEFAVHPDHEGEGLGTQLMTGLCDRLAAAGHEAVRLTVHAGDDRARGFYRRRGFEVLERRPDHFADGDGLLLTRSLEPEYGDAAPGDAAP